MTATLFLALVLAAVTLVLASLVREVRALRAEVAGLGEAQRRSALLAAEGSAAVMREALSRAAEIERATLPDARPSDTDLDLEDEVTRIVSPPREPPANDGEPPRSTLLPPPMGKKKP